MSVLIIQIETRWQNPPHVLSLVNGPDSFRGLNENATVLEGMMFRAARLSVMVGIDCPLSLEMVDSWVGPILRGVLISLTSGGVKWRTQERHPRQCRRTQRTII